MRRIAVYLSDEELALLEREASVTGASRSELIRRAVRFTYRELPGLTKEEKIQALRASAGLWRDRKFTGSEYVDAIRGGDMNAGLRRLGVD